VEEGLLGGVVVGDEPADPCPFPPEIEAGARYELRGPRSFRDHAYFGRRWVRGGQREEEEALLEGARYELTNPPARGPPPLPPSFLFYPVIFYLHFLFMNSVHLMVPLAGNV